MPGRRRLPFLERRKVALRVEGYIARGLDALEAGAELPAARPINLTGASRVSLDGVAVQLERVRRLGDARGLDEDAVITAAIRLGAAGEA